MSKVAELKEVLLDNVDVMKDIVRELNSWNGCLDHLEAHENDEEFFNMYFEGRPMEAVRAVQYGEYSYTDDLVRFDGLGNLDSFSYSDYDDELRESVDEIIEQLIENRDEISLDPDIEELLEDDEDEE